MKLAINGGKPLIVNKSSRYISIGDEEKRAALRVMESGCLSNFYGSNNDFFYGGAEILSLEKQWSDFFDVEYAISMNSATSGLIAAIGALGIGPGDEVIVPPYTMSATVSSVLWYRAIPVFADIEDETFGLDPISVEQKITSRTKAIVVVHLFGHPARIDEIVSIANKYNIKIIEDCAQSPAAICKNKYVGLFGDIGVYSLNTHKVINTGEGGICVTSDKELMERIALIRNHAESVIAGGKKVNSLINMLGFNFRMTELQAAIGQEQLKKLDALNKYRTELAFYLSEKLKNLTGIIVPLVRTDCTHVWYTYCIKVDPNKLGISRNLFAKALAAEGAPFYPGYVCPLYMLPVFQKRVLFSFSCPFSCELNKNTEFLYNKGICPTCEYLEDYSLIQTEQIRPPLTFSDIDCIYNVFVKIFDNIEELKEKSYDIDVLPPDPAGRREIFKAV